MFIRFSDMVNQNALMYPVGFIGGRRTIIKHVKELGNIFKVCSTQNITKTVDWKPLCLMNVSKLIGRTVKSKTSNAILGQKIRRGGGARPQGQTRFAARSVL